MVPFSIKALYFRSIYIQLKFISTYMDEFMDAGIHNFACVQFIGAMHYIQDQILTKKYRIYPCKEESSCWQHGWHIGTGASVTTCWVIPMTVFASCHYTRVLFRYHPELSITLQAREAYWQISRHWQYLSFARVNHVTHADTVTATTILLTSTD